MRRQLEDRLRSTRNKVLRTGAKVKKALLNFGLSTRFLASGLPVTIALARQQKHRFGRPRDFAQGLETARSSRRILAWNILNLRPLVVIFVNGDELPDEAGAWIPRARTLLGGTFVVHRDRGARDTEVPGFITWTGTRGRLHQEIIRLYPDHDAILLDAREPLPDVASLVALKYAAFRYPRNDRIGIVAPSRLDRDGAMHAGIDYERASGEWVAPRLQDVRDYGQFDLPRFVLTDQMHGLYIKAAYIHALPGLPNELTDWNDIAASWIADGWRAGSRTLLYPAAEIETFRQYVPPTNTVHDWQGRRTVRNAAGITKVIFVLPATTLSGGIRAVLEQGDGLQKLGMEVEIWALGPQPEWTQVDIQVLQFKDYDSLLDALSPERAIKVATWWETAEIVWLASVNQGIPVQYVQEFEAWFYRDDRVGQASVVSNYRREFLYTTTAEFQQQELAEIGIRADMIPPAFDDTVFRARPDIERRDDTLLALGRSFFQKNFELTLAAWRRLGAERPRLVLFGIEPRIARDPRIEYHLRPSDEEVAQLYSSATAFVQTSLHEGFSLPIIEAMATGCPVITTDSHGNRFCIDELNCVMVRQNDVEDVAAAIERVMADPDLRARLRLGGLETAARFTWRLVLEQSRAFYEKVAEGAQ